MHTLELNIRLPAVVAALVVLAACSGSPDQSAPSNGTSRLDARARSMFALTRRDALPSLRAKSPRRSWLSPAAKKTKALLYVADNGTYPGTVDLYDYKNGAMLGQSGGIGYILYGMCSDKDGNAYVTDFATGNVYEIEHATTTVIDSWNSNGEAIGCSVNPRNGDLAVTNFYDFASPSGTGGVIVYPGGGPSGTDYPGPGYLWPAGYDRHGNLFAQGNYAGQCPNPCLAELSAGASTWSLLTVSGATIYYPAAVEWDGKYLGVGDQEGGGTSQSVIYQMSVKNGTATVANSVVPSAGCSGGYVDIVQWAYDARKPNDLPVKHATQMAAGSSCDASVFKWKYPAGGDPTGEIPDGTFPYGLTIVSQ
jgi:hypothetical protein